MTQLSLIRAFVEVARTGSFAAAARNLHASRSNISKQVSALERELGVQLLLRSTHHVAPTRARALFLEGGSQLLGAMPCLRTRYEQEPAAYGAR